MTHLANFPIYAKKLSKSRYNKCNKYIKRSQFIHTITVTMNRKFGEASTISTLFCADEIYNKHKDEMKQYRAELETTTHMNSHLKNYSCFEPEDTIEEFDTLIKKIKAKVEC